AASVELADAAAGHHEIELVAGDVAPGVRHLHDHLLALDGLGAGIVGVVLALARELDAVTLAAVRIGLGDVAVGETIRDGLGRFVVTSEGAAAVASAVRVAGPLNAVLAAAVTIELRTMRLAAVPVTGREALAAVHFRQTRTRA